jgi:hypothetical protein
LAAPFFYAVAGTRVPPRTYAQYREIAEAIQADLPDGQISSFAGLTLSSPLCKNILIFRRPKSVYNPSPSCPTEGRAHVTNAGRDAVDADGAFDERR